MGSSKAITGVVAPRHDHNRPPIMHLRAHEGEPKIKNKRKATSLSQISPPPLKRFRAVHVEGRSSLSLRCSIEQPQHKRSSPVSLENGNDRRATINLPLPKNSGGAIPSQQHKGAHATLRNRAVGHLVGKDRDPFESRGSRQITPSGKHMNSGPILHTCTSCRKPISRVSDPLIRSSPCARPYQESCKKPALAASSAPRSYICQTCHAKWRRSSTLSNRSSIHKEAEQSTSRKTSSSVGDFLRYYSTSHGPSCASSALAELSLSRKLSDWKKKLQKDDSLLDALELKTPNRIKTSGEFTNQLHKDTLTSRQSSSAHKSILLDSVQDEVLDVHTVQSTPPEPRSLRGTRRANMLLDRTEIPETSDQSQESSRTENMASLPHQTLNSSGHDGVSSNGHLHKERQQSSDDIKKEISTPQTLALKTQDRKPIVRVVNAPASGIERIKQETPPEAFVMLKQSNSISEGEAKRMGMSGDERFKLGPSTEKTILYRDIDGVPMPSKRIKPFYTETPDHINILRESNFFKAFPEYAKPSIDTMSEADIQKKVAEIKKRPSRKEMWDYRLVHVRNYGGDIHDEKDGAWTPRLADKMRDDKAKDPDVAMTDEHTAMNLGDIFNLPANPLLMLYERGLTFRDGTLSNGKLPRARVVYKVGKRLGGGSV